MRSKQTSARCKQMNEQMSVWPSTNGTISKSSVSLCPGRLLRRIRLADSVRHLRENSVEHHSSLLQQNGNRLTNRQTDVAKDEPEQIAGRDVGCNQSSKWDGETESKKEMGAEREKVNRRGTSLLKSISSLLISLTSWK